jgi:hypothetical protein
MKKFFKDLLNFVFILFLISVLGMICVEQFWPGFVVNWVNVNIFLMIFLIVAIIVIVFNGKKNSNW